MFSHQRNPLQHLITCTLFQRLVANWSTKDHSARSPWSQTEGWLRWLWYNTHRWDQFSWCRENTWKDARDEIKDTWQRRADGGCDWGCDWSIDITSYITSISYRTVKQKKYVWVEKKVWDKNQNFDNAHNPESHLRSYIFFYRVST